MAGETTFLPYGIIVEKATVTDVPQIVDLWAVTYVPTYTGITSDLTEEYLRGRVQDKTVRDKRANAFTQRILNDSSVLYVAKFEENIVGYGAAEINAEGNHENSELYLADGWRGIGIGRALTRPRVLWHNGLHNRPVDIFLYVTPGTPAVDFHEHLGFRTTGKTTKSIHESGRAVPLIEMKLAVQDQHLALNKRGVAF